MKSQTLDETKSAMIAGGEHWYVPFMDFVDDFRRTKEHAHQFGAPLILNSPRFDALLASTVECLCDEQGIEAPEWVWNVPALKEPWFVAGIENLKALGIAQSPVYYRRRLIFVLENFLSRV